MRKQKVICAVLGVLLLLCLSGCTNRTVNTQNLEWHQQLSPLLRQNSYTVHLRTTKEGETSPQQETTACFDGERSYMTTAEQGEERQEVYYSRADGKCAVYGWNEENDIWIRQEIEDSDNYFYAYSVMERLEKLGAWIDLGEIRYDKNRQCYCGENLSGSYVCDGQAHQVLAVEIFLENNRVSSFSERYCVTENGREQIYCDTVWVENFGLTQVELPVNCISAEEIGAVDSTAMTE